MSGRAPFLDVNSFAPAEDSEIRTDLEAFAPLASPFISIYEVDQDGTAVDPSSSEFMYFLNELYDQEFDEVLYGLANEATAIYETRFGYEQQESMPSSSEPERVLEQHFAPLVSESEAMLGFLASEFMRPDSANPSDSEIDQLIDQYQFATEFNPSFEHFGGWLKKAVKKVAKKATNLAKRGLAAAAKLGLGPILNRLKALIKPLLRKVLMTAIGRLPSSLQPVARKLAERLPFLKEFETDDTLELGSNATHDMGEIQQEFNYQIASLIFAPSEVEQELELARVISEAQAPLDHSLSELDQAREQFVNELNQLSEGEDPTPYVENFLPAILPALRIGIRLAGRKRVVGFLAKFLGRYIRRFVGPQFAPALSKAIVDAGLRLMSLEITEEDEARTVGSAIAATVEDTVRRVSALPDYILDDPELLESFVLESFEQAASANLPAVLPEKAYRQRPELLEAKTIRGTWIPMPIRGRRQRYKKYSRVISARLDPLKVSAIQSFGGTQLDEFLQEQLGVLPAEDVEARVHLYEAIPGTLLSEVARFERHVPGLGSTQDYVQLHPLTPESASVLLGERGLGRDVDPQYLADPFTSEVGQRFYYLEVPGKRLMMTPDPGGQSRARHPTEVSLVLDFRANEVRAQLYLSEVRAQSMAVRLRQPTSVGRVTASLGRLLDRGMDRALMSGNGRLKIIHETVVPDSEVKALQRLPSLVTQALRQRLTMWVYAGLSGHLKEVAPQFIAAADEPADGVTLVMTMKDPPGFSQLREALRGKAPSLGSLRMLNGKPAVSIQIKPGHGFE